MKDNQISTEIILFVSSGNLDLNEIRWVLETGYGRFLFIRISIRLYFHAFNTLIPMLLVMNVCVWGGGSRVSQHNMIMLQRTRMGQIKDGSTHAMKSPPPGVRSLQPNPFPRADAFSHVNVHTCMFALRISRCMHAVDSKHGPVKDKDRR